MKGDFTMPINLKKESVNLNEVLKSQYGQTVIESDIIVPDVKPDILKVLDVGGIVSVTGKSVQQDKIIIQGTVRLTVLYAPDGEVLGNVKTMTTTQMFTHMVDAGSSKPNLNISAEAEVVSVSHALLNSRKLSIKTNVGVNVKATAGCVIDVATGLDCDHPVETKTSAIRACNALDETERDILLKSQLTIPAGKPACSEMLKADPVIRPREVKMLENKVMIKGEVCLYSLYAANDEECGIHFMEHEVPFNEFLEVDGVNEFMDADIDYNLKECFYEMQEDSDGDMRILNVEIVLSVMVKPTEIVELTCIEDAYSLAGELSLTKETYGIEQLVNKTNTPITHRDTCTLDDSLPAVSQIYSVLTAPNVTNVSIENKNIVVEGMVQSKFLYLSADEASPLCAYTHDSPFVHTIDAGFIDEDCVCDAKISVEHVSYNITLDREIEIRLIIGLTVKTMKKSQAVIITDMELCESAEIDPHPSIVIYFVQKNDSLWSIAKHYKTTAASIKQHNNLESDTLKIGQQLMIS